MLKTAFANLRAHKLRLLLSSIAIMLGVGFVAGTLVLTDTMSKAYDDGFARNARNVDVAVVPTIGVQLNPGLSGDDAKHLITPSMLDAVRAVPGVAAAEGRVAGFVPLLGANGRVITNQNLPGYGIAVPSDKVLQGFDVTSGRLPRTAGEAVVDKSTATLQKWSLGAAITALDAKDVKHTYQLVGVIDFGVDQRYADSSVIGLLPDTALALSGTSGWVEIDARAGPGVSQSDLAHRVEAATGQTGSTVLTGPELTKQLDDKASKFTQQFTIALLAFAVIALFVAALVIANTFAILVAQRSRELALLRCVGATRRQVFGSLLAESVVVGFIASAAGVGVGIGLAVGIRALFQAVGVTMPSGPVAISPNTAVIAIALGVVVTVVSAALPARAATKVPPVAALGSQVEARITKKTGRIRTGLGLLLVAGGIALAVGPLLGTKADSQQFLQVGGGGGLVFLGVLILGPVIVPPVAAALGWLPGRVFGPTAKLATANTRRNPRRVAATTAALTIGITIMSAFTVLGSSVKVSAAESLKAHYPFDYAVGVQQGLPDRLVSTRILSALQAAPQLQSVVPYYDAPRTASLPINGGRVTVDVSALGGDTSQYSLAATKGTFTGLGLGQIAVSDQLAKQLGADVGTVLPLRTPAGTKDLKVTAIFKSAGGVLHDAGVSAGEFAADFGNPAPTKVFITAKAGVPTADSRAAVDAAAASDPLVQVISQAEYRDKLNSNIDSLLALFGALVGLAILIAFFGIANTLSLSVVERTRESGLLRALGLTKGQLRRMLLAEAALMAVVGIGIGVTVGSAFGWSVAHLFTHSAGEGAVSIPVVQILLYVLAGALAGIVAAVLPSRRAAKTSIVAAMADV